MLGPVVVSVRTKRSKNLDIAALKWWRAAVLDRREKAAQDADREETKDFWSRVDERIAAREMGGEG